MKNPEHGLSQDDLETFQSMILSECIEESHLWSCLGESDLKEEVGHAILEKLVQIYNLSMWSAQAFPPSDPQLEIEEFED